MAAMFANWNVLYPNALTYSNCYGNRLTTAQLATYMRNTNPDLILRLTPTSRNSIPERTGTKILQCNTASTGILLGNRRHRGLPPYPLRPIPEHISLLVQRSVAPGVQQRLEQFASWAFGYSLSPFHLGHMHLAWPAGLQTPRFPNLGFLRRRRNEPAEPQSEPRSCDC